MILYNGPSMIDGQPIVVIATGWQGKGSKNSKTGPMVQVWILARDSSPISAIQEGLDKSICGDCKHRGTLGDRTCYVNVGKAPTNVWKKFQRGGYPQINWFPHLTTVDETRNALATFGEGRTIRCGSYGDPGAVPMWIWYALLTYAKGWTGYTHLWKNNIGQPLFMASVDSPVEKEYAERMGWRTFRVTSKGDSDKLNQEISCPASAESGYRTTCDQCQLCNGMQGQPDNRKSIVIQAHGVLAGRI